MPPGIEIVSPRSSELELEILRREYQRECAVRRDLERRVRDAVQLEHALRAHLGQVERLQSQLSTLCGAVVSTIARLLDARDGSTSAHSHAVMELSVELAQTLELAPPEVEAVRVAALLHDVGKIAVADALLQKNGPLDDTEWEAMREHPALAQRLLVGLPLPRAAIQAIRHHHERFDGSGYPDGLAGQSIPLGARIISVADAFHAITSDRPYRRRQTIAQALHEIERCAGTQFCPRVVGAFVRLAVRPGFGRPVCAA